MHNLKQLITQNAALLGFGFVMMFLTSPGQTYFIALFGGELRQALSLTHGEFGAVYSVATLCSAFLLLKTGSLIDQIDLRKFAVGCLLLLSAASLIMASTTSIWSLFMAILILRQVGQGLMSMTSSTAMMRYIPQAKAKANSLTNMGYSVAEAIMPSMVVILLAWIGWRCSWMAIAGFLAVIAPVCVLLLLKHQPQRHAAYLQGLAQSQAADKDAGAASAKHWTRAQVLRDPYFYLLTPALLSQSLLYTGFMFHQIHLVETKGWSLTLWGSLYALFSATAITTSLLIGAWADRIGAVRLAPFVTLPMAVGLAALSTSNTHMMAIVFMVAMGISSGAQGALSAPFYSERYGTRHFGSIKSLASFAMVIMSAISPVLLGWLIDIGISMNTLLLGGSLYAFAIISISALAAHNLPVEIPSQPQ